MYKNKYYFQVETLRKIIFSGYVWAYSCELARKSVYDSMLSRGLLNDNHFYKVYLSE